MRAPSTAIRHHRRHNNDDASLPLLSDRRHSNSSLDTRRRAVRLKENRDRERERERRERSSRRETHQCRHPHVPLRPRERNLALLLPFTQAGAAPSHREAPPIWTLRRQSELRSNYTHIHTHRHAGIERQFPLHSQTRDRFLPDNEDFFSPHTHTSSLEALPPTHNTHTRFLFSFPPRPSCLIFPHTHTTIHNTHLPTARYPTSPLIVTRRLTSIYTSTSSDTPRRCRHASYSKSSKRERE